ncbi:T9SS type A sorting domain-containing protein, partial [bacterium]|nr:T9SS type A sorting domain-containing protein [bacterium]
MEINIRVILKSVLIIILVLFHLPLYAISYVDLFVEGIPADSMTQDQTWAFELDCVPEDTVFFFIFEDVNTNGMIDSADIQLFNRAYIVDNDTLSTEVTLFDSDITAGIIYCEVWIHFWPSSYFIQFREDSTIITRNMHVGEADSVSMSLSGSFILEGITPPHPLLKDIIFLGGRLDPLVGGFVKTDSMGNFLLNWFAEPGNIIVAILDEYEEHTESGYVLKDYIDSVLIDGHVTGYEIYIPFFVPDSGIISGTIMSSSGEPVHAESLFMITVERCSHCGVCETLFTGTDEYGFFEASVSYELCDGISGNGIYYKIPEAFLKPHLAFYYFFPFDPIDHWFFNDTLFEKNDTIWLIFEYDSSTVPISEPLPLLLNGPGYTTASLYPEILTPIMVYNLPDSSEGEVWYTIDINREETYPENYILHRDHGCGGSPGDTIFLSVGEARVSIAGSLFSITGEMLPINGYLRIFEYRHGDRWSSASYGTIISEGTFSDYLFDNSRFGFLINEQFEGYMLNDTVYYAFSPGTYTTNLIYLPLDSIYWLYLEVDSEDTLDNQLSAYIYNDIFRAFYEHNFHTNRWVAMPIYSGFTEASRLKIQNIPRRERPPFTRLIEDNGNIPVMPGDSLYITVTMPVDYFIMEFVEDTADAWQHTMQINGFHINYYDRTGGELIYRYEIPYSASYSITCPVFGEPMNVRAEPKYWFWNLHYFIANPEGFTIGGPYRPDRVQVYLNKGSGELLMSFIGYPPYYLPSDTFFLMDGSATGVEIPEFPGHHYETDFFIFEMVPYRHPYGFGTVMYFHDVCDGEWTIAFPETLPGGFKPLVRDTSFYCEDISVYPDEWQEFDIHIPCGAPSGVHGYINRDSYFLQANLLEIKYYQAYTDSLVASKMAWQYYPWGNLSRIVKHYIKETELPTGDYYATLNYEGYFDAEPFIYPDKISFNYEGDSLLIPDFYVGNTKGVVHIRILDLSPSLYEDAYISLSIPEASIPYTYRDFEFYLIEAQYPFPEIDSTFHLNLSSSTWIIKPIHPMGLIAEPIEALITIPLITDTLVHFDLNFSYSGVSEDGSIFGKLFTDADDPNPVSFDSFRVLLKNPESGMRVYETHVEPSGLFEFAALLSPAQFILEIIYDGTSDVFYPVNQIRVDLPPDATADIGSLYVDNANATVIVGFSGLTADQLNIIDDIRFNPISFPFLEDTIALPYIPGRSRDTFFICDGLWTVIPHKVPGIEFVPSDSTILIEDMPTTHTIIFNNPAWIPLKSNAPEHYSLTIYPNPFNSILTIQIRIPLKTAGKLEIYNLYGHKLNTIAQQIFLPGVYKYSWNLGEAGNGNLSSGIYFI